MKLFFESWRRFLNEQVPTGKENQVWQRMMSPEGEPAGWEAIDIQGPPMPEEEENFNLEIHDCQHGNCYEKLVGLANKHHPDNPRKNPYIDLKSNWMSQYFKKDLKMPVSMRSEGSQPKFIVLHVTETPSISSTIRGFTSKKSKRHVSSHYEVSQDGEAFNYVDPKLKTNHAGGINDLSIGVDMTNQIGFGLQPSSGWPSSQIHATTNLVKYLCKVYNIPTVVAPWNFNELLLIDEGHCRQGENPVQSTYGNIKYAEGDEWDWVKSTYWGADENGICLNEMWRAQRKGDEKLALKWKKKREEIIQKFKNRRNKAIKELFANIPVELEKRGIGIVPHRVISPKDRSCPGKGFPYSKFGTVWQSEHGDKLPKGCTASYE